MNEVELKRTPLHALHVELGARMVPFAGYDMPVQYPAGILTEHLHTRAAAGLFDVSHMGQVWMRGGADIRERLEKLVPADVRDMARGAVRYSLLLNEQGGILDDLMITRPQADEAQSSVFLIVNAACKDRDLAHMRAALGAEVTVEMVENRALLALQGPKAASVLAQHCEAPQVLKFMQSGVFAIDGVGETMISRSGYTGEDGFEISLPATRAEFFARALLAHPDVLPIGLGARDSLRLEAGLPLYGHELDETTTPVEAGVSWAIAKRRRAEGGFPGAEVVQKHLAEGVARKLVALRPEGKAIAREHTEIQDPQGRTIGEVTSGGFGPSVEGPVAVGYVETAFAVSGTSLNLIVRGKPVSARVVALPFVPHRYVR